MKKEKTVATLVCILALELVTYHPKKEPDSGAELAIKENIETPFQSIYNITRTTQ